MRGGKGEEATEERKGGTDERKGLERGENRGKERIKGIEKR